MTAVGKIPSITVGLRPFTPPGHGTPPAVSALFITCSALLGGGARFVFTLEGRIDALRLPTRQAPFTTGPLWQHTCFEVFLSLPDKPGYREFNFSPNGLWAFQRFTAYRQIDRPPDILPPHIDIRHDENILAIDIELPADTTTQPPRFKVGLAAVIEHADGHLDYWAIHHPGEKPDFHLRESWPLILDTRPS
ncbi:MAG: DOMON-like domain-containing protein [Azoarcus sp.]|jgi:hypothetical protein|nr:DOMON-like domain-containing protein [Azoarcus sp.]